ncbi:MAG: CASTOR/POLLUX-related putative ion channel [Iamia sp.]
MNPEERRLRRRLRYRLDRAIGKGGWRVLGMVVALFLVALGVVSVLRVLAVHFYPGGEVERGRGPLRQIWLTWLEMTDPGTQAYDIDSSAYFKVFAVAAGVLGIALLSAVIALMTTAIDVKLRKLRRGHTPVVEHDHTLILGWNERVMDILGELVTANASQRSASIVILADCDKEEMDDAVRLHLDHHRTTSIVTRSGATTDLSNLRVAEASRALSIIVLAAPGAAASEAAKVASDLDVIRTVLGVTAGGSGRAQRIVAEILTASRRPIARAIAPGVVTCFDQRLLMAELLVQCSRGPGIAAAYSEMLSFEGAEPYFVPAGHAAGARFGDLALRMVDGIPLGVQLPGSDRIVLNPDPDTRVEAGSDLIVLADDDSTIDIAESVRFRPSGLTPSTVEVDRPPEQELIIGSGERVAVLIEEFLTFLPSGSRIDVVSPNATMHLSNSLAGLTERTGVTAVAHDVDPTDPAQLTELHPWTYNNILLVADTTVGPQGDDSDADTLITLLNLRTLLGEGPQGSVRPTIITELVRSENEPLVNHIGVYDVIVSNRLVSTMLVQVAEEPKMAALYEVLLTSTGSEVHAKPIEWYCGQDRQPAFADLIVAAQARREIALGVCHVRDSDGRSTVVLNPPKDAPVECTSGTRLIVLAEESY